MKKSKGGSNAQGRDKSVAVLLFQVLIKLKGKAVVTGDKGGKVVLQFSENLDKWIDMQTYANESGQLWININRGADAGRLFFRVRAE